jgi:hypothetical protein
MAVGCVLVARQSVAHEDGVATLVVQNAIGLVGDLQMVKAVAGIEKQRILPPESSDEARWIIGLVRR